MTLSGGCPHRVLVLSAALAAAALVSACGGGGDNGVAQASTLTTADASQTDASAALVAPTTNWDDTASAADATATTVAAADTSSATASTSTSASTSTTAAATTTTSTSTTASAESISDLIPPASVTDTTTASIAAASETSSTLTAASASTTLKAQSVTTSSAWGTVLRPFSANSPWNSRPIKPVLSTKGIPKSSYYPAVAAGAYSTGVYVAAATDVPMTIKGPSSTVGITNVDAGGAQDSVTIPRWPASTVPATGSDGHCEIYDPIAGVIHSFWQLKNVNGTWRAALYGWTKLDGTGWGNPAHYYQGARATGVVSSAGLIRKHEVDDGDTMYRHVLAMSLTYNGLASSPTYNLPATAADIDAAGTNTGLIPEGALMMLPSTFDTSKLTTPKLRKIAETLKTYGARVVDRNVGTPFVIYVEIGASFNLYPNGWNNTVAAELDTIRAALRAVQYGTSWVNGNGAPVTFTPYQNVLSMRGVWKLQSGDALAPFDTLKQAVVFPAKATRVVQINSNGTGFTKVTWAKPAAGQVYKITAHTTGGGQFRLSFTDCKNAANSIDSGALSDGQTYQFTWPSSACWNTVYAISGVNQVSTVSADVVRIN